jgi:hypothetical protein
MPSVAGAVQLVPQTQLLQSYHAVCRLLLLLPLLLLPPP